MIHWAFLILAFIAGFAVCFAICWYVRFAGEIGARIERMGKAASDFWGG